MLVHYDRYRGGVRVYSSVVLDSHVLSWIRVGRREKALRGQQCNLQVFKVNIIIIIICRGKKYGRSGA